MKNKKDFLSVAILVVVISIFLMLKFSTSKFNLDENLRREFLLSKAFSEKSINDILPFDYPINKVYFIDISENKNVPPFLSFDELYAVRFDPIKSPLIVDGVTMSNVVGMAAFPGLDMEINYSEEKREVIKYNPDNGVHSGGDLVFLFYD